MKLFVCVCENTFNRLLVRHSFTFKVTSFTVKCGFSPTLFCVVGAEFKR